MLGAVEVVFPSAPQMWAGGFPNVQAYGTACLLGLFTVVFVGIKYISRTALLFLCVARSPEGSEGRG